MRLNLLIEELFTNTVVHGGGGDSDTPVHLELGVEPASLSLLFADRAPPFDPLAWREADPSTVPAALEDRPVGRLGIRLVLKMASRIEYERADGWNRLRLDLDRRS
jgi:anti-sigma regulatory factor (Ser/Thr protein kinase)